MPGPFPAPNPISVKSGALFMDIIMIELGMFASLPQRLDDKSRGFPG
jgi:hypothetical protein